MKAKKRRNRGTIVFLSIALIIAIGCAIFASVEKDALADICLLCERELNIEEILPTDFSRASFYNNEFRGVYNGKLIMAEKTDGRWQITEIKNFGRYSDVFPFGRY